MFVKERVAAMKKLEDAREKARMAAELSKKGKTMASGNALNTSSSDRHTTGSSVSIPEVSPPMTVKTVIRVGPREGDISLVKAPPTRDLQAGDCTIQTCRIRGSPHSHYRAALRLMVPTGRWTR